MSQLTSLTPEEFERVAGRLRNPAPGGRVEAAREFGVDITLLIEQLRLTPAERASKLQRAVSSIERFRGAARSRA